MLCRLSVRSAQRRCNALSTDFSISAKKAKYPTFNNILITTSTLIVDNPFVADGPYFFTSKNHSA